MMQEENKKSSRALQEARNAIEEANRKQAQSLNLEFSEITPEELDMLIGENLNFFNKLQKLNLNECKNLNTLPASIQNLRELKVLNCDYSPIETLPPELGTINSLTELNLTGAKITSLPLEICRLIKLQKLNLDSCFNLQTLPSNIGNLKNLQNLSLQGSSLESLPKSLTELSALQRLYLSESYELSSFPDGMKALTKLQELSFANCSFRTISEDLLGMPGLKIYASDNRLRAHEIKKLQDFINTRPVNSVAKVYFEPEEGLDPEDDIEIIVGALLSAFKKNATEEEINLNKDAIIKKLEKYPELAFFIEQISTTRLYTESSLGLNNYSKLLIPILENTDEALLQKVEIIASQTSNSCEDKVVVGLLQMNEAVKLNNAKDKLSNMNPVEIFEIFKNTAILEDAYSFVLKEGKNTKEQTDYVEEYLVLINKIKQPLGMKNLSDTYMFYEESANIKKRTVEKFLEKYGIVKNNTTTFDTNKMQEVIIQFLVDNCIDDLLTNKYLGDTLKKINCEFEERTSEEFNRLSELGQKFKEKNSSLSESEVRQIAEYDLELLGQKTQIAEINLKRKEVLVEAIKAISKKEETIYTSCVSHVETKVSTGLEKT